MGIFENQRLRKVSKKGGEAAQNHSKIEIRLNVYGYEGTLWDRIHDLDHFGVQAAWFFDFKPQSDDFLCLINESRALILLEILV